MLDDCKLVLILEIIYDIYDIIIIGFWYWFRLLAAAGAMGHLS